MTITKITIHCSASEFGDVQEIDKWHRERGFNKIGYHFVILNGKRKGGSAYKASEDGLLETGRGETEVGAHVKGHNTGNIGICLIGNKGFSRSQFDTLVTLLRELMHRHNVAPDNIYGHYEFDPGKTCPGFNVEVLRACFRSERRNNDS